MLKTMIYISILSYLFLGDPITAQANRFFQNGFQIDLMWKSKTNEFVIWGDVRNGKECNALDLSFSFENSKSNRTIYLNTRTKKPHNPQSPSWFRENREMRQIKNKNYWRIKSYNLRCL